MNKIISFSMVLLVILAVAGCSVMESIWPAKVPAEIKSYLEVADANVGWESIGRLTEFRAHAITKNVITQLDCKAVMEKDEATFKLAIDQANINLENARTEFQTAVGTIEHPGWLLSILIALGGGVSGRFITTLTHYNEKEYQEGIAKATNGTS